MADWIKMRASLLTNTKVSKMARTLLVNPDFREWYGNAEISDATSQTVTLRHVTVVTRVVVGGLLPVWASVNESAGRDGHLRHASLFDIDAMSGIPGFGAAMEAVDWLTVLPETDGLEFGNFIEHNTPEQERSTSAKTGAERAKDYRERKAAEKAAGVTNGVTEKSDASRDTVTTEESRGEENSSSLRSEEDAGKPATPAKPKRKTLKTYLDECKQAGRKPLPPDHAIREYCRDAKISDEMLQVAWVVFRDDYLQTAEKQTKKYIDWPGHFGNAVKKNWGKVWYTDAGGSVIWTSVGLQAKGVLDERARAREANNDAT
jgi:hypothetical protein